MNEVVGGGMPCETRISDHICYEHMSHAYIPWQRFMGDWTNVIVERFALYDVDTLDKIGSVLFARVSRDNAGGEQSTDNGGPPAGYASPVLLLLRVSSLFVRGVFLQNGVAVVFGGVENDEKREKRLT